MKIKKILSLIVACVMATMVLASCGDKETEKTSSNLPAGEVSYPIDSEETLSVWKNLTGNISAQAPTENDIPFTEGLIKRTGIKVNYMHPPAGQAGEKFNIMIASGELPDIVEYSLSSTSEGIDGLIDAGYVKELDEEFLKAYAPNLWRKMEEDPELKKWCMSNDGRFFGFPGYRENDNMTVFTGLIIRDDLLKQAGLGIPETIDEWHTALTTFKNMGIENPLSFNDLGLIFDTCGAFTGAFGVKLGFYADNGKIKFGSLEDGYKTFLETMHQWYEEGLIDKNFASMQKTELDSKVLNSKTGATFGIIGSYMGTWLAAKDGDPDFSLAAAPYPTLNKGEVAKFGYKDSKYNEPKYWITGTCKNPELAARFLDYGYSEEGQMYYNFGEEGVSYTMKDGIPTYTDLITNNPDGLSPTHALTKYTHASYLGTYMMDERFFKQQYVYDAQKNAIDVWSKTNASDHYVYGMTALSSEDNNRFSSIMTDIYAYVSEMTTKYIMGIEDLSTFDSFVQKIYDMDIEEAIALRQKGYDSFINR